MAGRVPLPAVGPRLGPSRAAFPLPVTTSYLLALVCVQVALGRLGPSAQAELTRLASTNLHQLGSGNVSTLLTSAFVLNGGQSALWWIGLAAVLSAAELAWGGRRLIAVFLAGHVGATLIVAAGLTAGIFLGWTSVGVAHATDVGVSYGTMTLIGTLSERWPGVLRHVWVAVWSGVVVIALVLDPDFTAFGHMFSLVIGLGIAFATGRHRKPDPRAAAAATGEGAGARLPRHRPPRRNRPRRKVVSWVAGGGAVAVTIFAVVVVGPGVVLAHTAKSGHTAALPRPASWTLAGLGDSVPAAADCDCKSFIDLYGAQVTHDTGLPVTVKNLGVDGQTSAELLAALGSGQQDAATVRAADIVSLTIGANDFVYAQDQVQSGKCGDLSCFGSTMTTMRQNLGAIVSRIKALRYGRPTAIIITDYWNVFPDGSVARQQFGGGFLQTSDQLTKQVDAVIQQVAGAAKTTFVDLYTPFKGPSGNNDDTSLLASDGDHPDQAGHQLIAQTIAAATPMRGVTTAYSRKSG